MPLVFGVCVSVYVIGHRIQCSNVNEIRIEISVVAKRIISLHLLTKLINRVLNFQTDPFGFISVQSPDILQNIRKENSRKSSVIKSIA